MFQCPECGRGYETSEGVDQHRAGKHGVAVFADTRVPCDECGRSYGNLNALARHRKRDHGFHTPGPQVYEYDYVDDSDQPTYGYGGAAIGLSSDHSYVDDDLSLTDPEALYHTPAICCERCGRLDASLRIAAFQYVYSALLFTSRKVAVGVWCSGCRRTEGWKWSLLTFFLGWWGIPWGPIYSIGALAQNIGGGEQPTEANAELLEVAGGELMERGEASEAALAFRESLARTNEPRVRRGLQVAEAAESAEPLPKVRVSRFRPGDVVVADNATLYLEPGGEQPIGSLSSAQAIVLRAMSGWVELRAPGTRPGWVSEEVLSAPKLNSGSDMGIKS